MDRLWTAFIEQDASKAPEALRTWLGDLFEEQTRYRNALSNAINDTERNALRKKFATRLLGTVSPSLVTKVIGVLAPPLLPPSPSASLPERMRETSEWIDNPTGDDDDDLKRCLQSLPSREAQKRVAHAYFSELINSTRQQELLEASQTRSETFGSPVYQREP